VQLPANCSYMVPFLILKEGNVKWFDGHQGWLSPGASLVPPELDSSYESVDLGPPAQFKVIAPW
jgi:hypothetical protein